MTGKTQETTGASSDIAVSVWRGKDGEGGYVRYSVPLRENQTVLDVVTWIQRHAQPDLSYRFACRVGVCGSCAMMVNGKPRWTCRTHVNKVLGEKGRTEKGRTEKGGTLEIAPLRSLPVVKDLTCDMGPFFDKWVAAEGRFVPTKTRNDPPAAIRPEEPERKAADAGIECINCGVCYAACDVVAWKPDYLGPAALNRAWTLVNDVRDAGQEKRLRAVAAEGGCTDCHSQQGCAAFCPVEINPTAAIAGLKRTLMRKALTGERKP